MIEKVKAMEQEKCNTKNVMLELFEFTIGGDSRFYKKYTNQLRKLRTSLSNAGVSVNTAEVVAAPDVELVRQLIYEIVNFSVRELRGRRLLLGVEHEIELLQYPDLDSQTANTLMPSIGL